MDSKLILRAMQVDQVPGILILNVQCLDCSVWFKIAALINETANCECTYTDDMNTLQHRRYLVKSLNPLEFEQISP